MSVELEGSSVEGGGHVVQFYAHEHQLSEAAGGFLGHALLGGAAAVVVASGPHRAALDAALTARGVDVDGVRRVGRYVAVDAAETLEKFMIDGSPDPERFATVVGGLLAKATEGGRPVRVFGEMVALLWDDGALAAAIELEKLWNDLAQRHSFSLFCAYPEQSVAPTGRRGALHDVCSHHTLVIQGETVDPAVTVHGLRSRRFDARVTSPREARHFIAETLTAWGRAELVDDASLIVSEFATNAVLHARSAFWVSASQIDRTVRLVVEDESQAPPAARSYGPEAATGRGLRLVDALADKWGVDLRTSGKAVWADLTS